MYSHSDENDFNLAPIIDHTLLKPDATDYEVLQYCDDAKRLGFCSIVVNPIHTLRVSKELAGSTVRTATVVGFPFGATSTTIKTLEAECAVVDGAHEIDFVIDIGALKSGRFDFIRDEIRSIRRATAGTTLKVIIEACLLANVEKIAVSDICVETGVDFIKTSTGYSKGGATVEDVALLRKRVGAAIGVKASGGIRTRVAAIAMVKAGASRIGTSVGPALITPPI